VTTLFYDTGMFPFVSLLERNWHLVRDELRALAAGEFIQWPEHSYYGEHGWDTFGLYAFGQRQPAGCARCPQTDRLVRQIPGLMMAGFSRLAPGAHIMPHRGYEGYSDYVLRLHLGLDIPDRCAIRVGDQTRAWEEGKCIVFCDAIEHEAWNRSDRSRTVLLVDFLNPMRRHPLLLNPQFTPEMIAFIEREHLPTQNFGQRAMWYLWKLFNPRLVREARRNVARDHPV
jgi:ornithine lipid ester-linked acyl 2-hydroxylase